MNRLPAATPELPGMPSDAELRFSLIVPAIGKIAAEPVPLPALDPDPDRRRAFGSTPNLIKAPLNPSLEVTPEDSTHIQPAYIGAALYNGRGKKTVDDVAFNPAEHKTFIFSMSTFLERVSDPVERKYAGANDFIRQEKTLLHRADALEKRLAAHDALLDGYRDEWGSIRELQRYASVPGFAHTTEGNLRSLATAVWQGPVTNMLRVVAQEKSWSQADMAAANEALLRALLYGAQRSRVHNWRVALAMVHKYTEDKGVIVHGRRNSIELRLRDIRTTLSNMYERTGFTPR